MRRFRAAGLCLVAVLGLTAVMASGAQAGQIGKCVKAKQETRKFHGGEYTDPYCATKASPAKTGKYEWEANKTTIPFASDGGSSHWKLAAGGDLECEGLADKGEYLPGGVKDTDTLTFRNCQMRPFEIVCRSYGAAYGEIKTNELASQFIDHGEKGLSGKEPAAGEVWEQKTAAGTHTDPVFGPGNWLADFECQDGIPFALSGSISGVVEGAYVNARLKAGRPGKRGGKLGKPTFKEAFTEIGGEQDLQAMFTNPEKEDKVESGPAVLEFTNDVMISPLEKGLEISGAV